MAGKLAGKSEPVGPNDADEILRRPIEIVVDNNIVEFAGMGDLPARRGEPCCDDLGTVLTAAAQALFEHFERRRQNEYRNGFAFQSLNLRRALPIDFEQYIGAG